MDFKVEPHHVLIVIVGQTIHITNPRFANLKVELPEEVVITHRAHPSRSIRVQVGSSIIIAEVSKGDVTLMAIQAAELTVSKTAFTESEVS